MRGIRLLITFLCFVTLIDVCAQDNFAKNSVLNSGTWYKIKIVQSGVYKLDYEDIISMGFNTPENLRIYGNGGSELPLDNGAKKSDDLIEVSLYANNGSDNVFGPGDYYIFYGEGIVAWSFNRKKNVFAQHINNYSLYSYYYLTTSFGAGKRIVQKDYSGLTSNQTITEYSWRDFYELESTNLIQSGRRWYGDRFEEDPFNYPFIIENLDKSYPVFVTASMAVRSENNKTVLIKANSINIDTLQFKKVLINEQEATYADTGYCYKSFLPSSNTISIEISLINSDLAKDQAFVDYVTLNARSSLKKNSNPFFFRDHTSIGDGNIAKFLLLNSDQNTRIWNISKHNNVFEVSGSLKSGNTYEFIAPNDSLQEYVAVDLSYNYPKPVIKDEELSDVGMIKNQDLHGMETPEYVIITHPSFAAEADSLAEFHRLVDNMTVRVVSTNQVYNEFSSGKPDISAIRNFVRMLWLRSNENDSLRYLLLFGDGSYDNHTAPDDNPNYIPTYQSVDSRVPTVSYTSDDFFGMLEPGEWKESGTMEIGVGRIPVSHKENVNVTEAMLVVKKIKGYYQKELMKDWRNQFIFLADDSENGSNTFGTDTDVITQGIEKKCPALNFNKIYMDAYEETSSSTGASYPEVEEAIIQGFNKGALVFNYMGHGGGNGLSQELVLQVSDVEKLINAPYFPLYITATCQLGRFDYVKPEGKGYSLVTSLGEAALLNPNGGAISLLTTTRMVYQDSNKNLTTNVYYYLFRKDSQGNQFRLGDIIRLAKNKTYDTSNKFKFTLLGDPALRIALPEYIVLTDSINEYSSEQPADTLNALGKATVTGYVANYDSTIISDFNGIVQIKVFDKKYIVTTKGVDGPAFDFTMQDRLLYRGKASVVNGRFKAEFKIPKDITYSLGQGKISYYAQNGIIDANGYYNNFIIGGTTNSYETDNEGPQIMLYINDESFRNEGITGPNPVLLVNIFDENGINTTGNGIGHDIVGVLDEDFTKNYLLNDYFESDLDNYKSGSLKYPFSELEEGHHSINVKVWDNYNNSSDSEIGFFVKQGDNMVIDKLFNYPNPMRDYTSFQYTHNLPGVHEVTLDVFDLAGRLVYSYHTSQSVEGFVSEPIVWQVNSSEGRALPPGVYPYRISVKVTSFDGLNNYEGTQESKIIIIP